MLAGSPTRTLAPGRREAGGTTHWSCSTRPPTSWTRPPVRSAAALPPRCRPGALDVLCVDEEGEALEGPVRQAAERLVSAPRLRRTDP